MIQLPFVDDWRIEADDADEPVLAGTRDGRPFRSRPVAALDIASHTARLVDGTMLHLGEPAEPADLACRNAVDPQRLQQIVGRARRDTLDLAAR
jgi:hypothetical protein